MNTDGMCFPSGHLHLSDFGLSRRLKRGGRAFTICGTMQYMGELSGEHPGESDVCDGWLLIVCWVTTVDPSCMLPLRWPTSAAGPQIHVLRFPLSKERDAPFFHHLCTNNLLFSVITSWMSYFSCWVWAAPEVLSGGPYSHAADWWSLGILLFALVTGKVRSHKLHIYSLKMGFFKIVSSLHLLVSSTCRAGSHHHAEQGQKLSLCHPQVLQLRSDLTADWGLRPPPEYPSWLCVLLLANICSISSLLV